MMHRRFPRNQEFTKLDVSSDLLPTSHLISNRYVQGTPQISELANLKQLLNYINLLISSSLQVLVGYRYIYLSLFQDLAHLSTRHNKA